MFLDSLSHGLKILVHPSVALASLLWMAAQVLYLRLIRWSTGQKEMGDAFSAGCLTQIVGVLFQALALGLLLLWILPVLLGLEPRASWTAVEGFAMLATRAGLVAALAIALLSFLPWLGHFLAGSPGLEVLIGGGILFRLLSHPYLEARLGRKIPAESLYPGLWESLGYLALAFVAGRLLMLATLKLRPAAGQPPNAFTRLWGPSLDTLVGIVVLYMYAQSVALRLYPGL